MARRDLDRVTLHFNDSRRPGHVTVQVLPTDIRGRTTDLDLTVAETAELAGRLLSVVQASGFNLTARRRNR